MLLRRRQFITLSLAGLGIAALAPYMTEVNAFAAEIVGKLALTNDEWKKRLTSQ